MTKIFSELNSLGLKNVDNVSIFEKEVPENKEQENVFDEQELLFDRSMTCPVCGRNFKTKSIRSGKNKLIRTDLDLRPVYDLVDPIKYDVVLCNKCGYASLNRLFQKITDKQIQLLKEKVSNQYTGKEYPPVYTYDSAIERYKLALYEAVIMQEKDSVKAYLCLKIAWLYRGYADEIMKRKPINEKYIQELEKEEQQFLENTYKGFKEAYEKERFPTLGLEEVTVTYLLGEIARRLGRYDESGKWISRILISRKANKRLKERARECKELIRKAKKSQ